MFLSKQLFRNVLASLVIFTHSVNCTGSEGLIHDRDIIKDHEILSANNSNNSTNKNSSDGSDSADSLKDKKPHTLAHNTVKMQNDLIHNRSSVRTNITPDDAYDKLCETYLIPYTNWNDKKMVDSRVATLEKSICEEAVYQEFDPYVATEYVCGFEMLYSKYKYEQNFLRDNINIETQEYLDAFNACYYTIKYDFKKYEISLLWNRKRRTLWSCT